MTIDQKTENLDCVAFRDPSSPSGINTGFVIGFHGRTLLIQNFHDREIMVEDVIRRFPDANAMYWYGFGTGDVAKISETSSESVAK